MSMSQNPHFLEGVSHYKKGEYEAAISAFTKAIEKEENPNIYSERAIAQYHLKNNRAALDDLNYALDLEPENPYRYSSRAYVKDSMGDTEGAIEDYKKAIELDPQDAVAHNNLGLLEEKLGYKNSAKKHFEKADDLSKDDFIPEKPDLNIAETSSNIAEAPKEEIQDNPEEQTQEKPSLQQHIRVMTSVFSNSKHRQEFWNFVRNGFKSKS